MSLLDEINAHFSPVEEPYLPFVQMIDLPTPLAIDDVVL